MLILQYWDLGPSIFFYLIDAYFHYSESFASGQLLFSTISCVKYMIGAGVHGEAAAGVVNRRDAYFLFNQSFGGMNNVYNTNTFSLMIIGGMSSGIIENILGVVQ